MRKELEKNYDPKIVEDRVYQNWLDKKYFHTEIDKTKTPFTIVIPPPNVTGQLHLGHAFDETIQDILIRFKRMRGFNALWVPGTDHAAISTETKIVEAMAQEGLRKSDVGREGFLERAWDWKHKYRGRITEQLQKLGTSCDWDRERFTLDEGLTKASMTVFERLYEKGYIYRDVKLCNWCPKCRTTISDAEVDHEERSGFYYHMQYKIKGTDKCLQFVTSRPETILGDTAIAVHPDDERYTELVGKTVIVPIVDREIPIIADTYVDKEFGTGVVKITPAHDPNDFEVGVRHNLPRINIMNDDGTINENGGKYAGLDRYDARKKIIEEFTSLGLFIKEEPMVNAVGEHERCHTTVEPLLKLQWFVKMEEMAKPALEALSSGELRFFPERFGKTYSHWLENIRDWCISRQLWWGHRIPAWYCSDCNHVNISADGVEKCEKCGSTNLKQDEDVLDTWFTSALWPFAVLGWPDETADFEHFFPTDVLVTGYDIIFFWVVRMAFSSIEQTGKLPFKDVIIHGLIRDSQGRKFSKSLGNGVDPIEIIEKYGADALRHMIITGNSMGNDMRFYYERIEASRNFLNKLWNATRFILMNFDEEKDPVADMSKLAPTDKWILSKCNTLAKEVSTNLDAYDFGIALQKIYEFVWDEFCDWYIEMVKPRLYNMEDDTRDIALWTLQTVLIRSLKLLHPFMPFITEEIFTSISDEVTIMLSEWPEFDEKFAFADEEKEITIIKEAVKSIRNIRSEMNVPPSRKAKLTIVCENSEAAGIFQRGEVYLKTLGYAGEIAVTCEKEGINDTDVSVIVPEAVIYMPLADLIDIDKEIERLNKEKEKLIKEVERVDMKLSNEGFVKKAPDSVINEEKEKREKYKAMLEQVEQRLEKYL